MYRLPVAAAVLLLALLPLSTAQAQGIEIRMLEPMPNALILGNSLTVIFEVSGIQIVPSSVQLDEAGKRPDANQSGQGHLHLMLDLQPVVIWDKTEPFTFTDIAPGEHLISIEIVSNDHSSLNPPVLVQHRVTVQEDTAHMQANVFPALPDTGLADVMQARRARLVWLLLALMIIDVGFIVRQYQDA